MILQLRNKEGELRAKDILDINFDMSIEKIGGKYRVKVSRHYYLDEEFSNVKDAEKELSYLADSRNSLEDELRSL